MIKEANILCDPMTSHQSTKGSEKASYLGKQSRISRRSKSGLSNPAGARSPITGSTEEKDAKSSDQSCHFCSKNHDTGFCYAFKSKSLV